VNPAHVDTSGIERLCDQWENGPGSAGERTREFCRLFPSELAKVRRQGYRQLGLLPVPIGGSSHRGLKQGFYMTRLRDGTLGYLQRRTDDCLQAALASALQIPANLVPDLGMEAKMAGGMDPELMERGIRAKMDPFLHKHGVKVRYHATPPTSSRRWIGVVREEDVYSDHCLLMSGPDCLFDPANLLPSAASSYDVSEVDYGITLND